MSILQRKELQLSYIQELKNQIEIEEAKPFPNQDKIAELKGDLYLEEEELHYDWQ